jgi:glycosyltransferase involved in cell wall biosynthesis
VSTDAELAAFYGGLSVLAHANDTGESFGLVIAEAMACGLPVVTHPAAGDRDNAQLELVSHGETGLVAETPEQYAQAVGWLFAHPAEARIMGRNGRDKAQRLYRAQDVAARLGGLYLDWLARKGRGSA